MMRKNILKRFFYKEKNDKEKKEIRFLTFGFGKFRPDYWKYGTAEI